ncbi:hypothetical protein GCM10009759_42400 [Kitasatospora saccharophila]|uniref:Uncharacterized protein n=1 Tax=Kitasatospora saccharophila TaxID=407973 RepID=A0ABN2X6Z8_9ACTN
MALPARWLDSTGERASARPTPGGTPVDSRRTRRNESARPRGRDPRRRSRPPPRSRFRKVPSPWCVLAVTVGRTCVRLRGEDLAWRPTKLVNLKMIKNKKKQRVLPPPEPCEG